MSTPTPQNAFTPFLALSSVISQNDLQELRMDNDLAGKIQYVGRTTIPNALTSNRVWYLVKYYYDTNGFLNRLQVPDNGVGMIYSWDDRATYFS